MTWGALITSDDGTPFITEESTPISLQGKYSASGSTIATVTVTINTEDVVLPFAVATGDAYFTYKISGTTLTVNAQRRVGDSGNFTLTVYVFTTRAQIPPSWGIAIWDKNGKCILTNETRVLTDIQIIGTKGGSDSGFNLNTTKSGKWAIVPDLAGYVVGVIQTGGGPRPVQIQYAFTASYNGSTTSIKPVMSESPPTGSGNVSYIDSKCAIRAIDVSRYE